VVSTRPLVEPTTAKREAGALAPNSEALFVESLVNFSSVWICQRDFLPSDDEDFEEGNQEDEEIS
jgi:hypothetical protein